MTKIKGIDVSEHNGVIDWNKVKADGVQFAMIRCGIGSDIKSQDDKQFERNVRECEKVGIPWGTYLYSYALNTAEAKSEAAHVLRLLKGKKPTYPVAFDTEDADGYKKKHGMPSDTALVNICDTFLAIVQNAGYEVCLYASLSWLDNQLKSSKLDKYSKWVAQWGPKCTYNKVFDLWQYTDSGVVDGIKGKVDMNHAYRDFKKEMVKVAENDWKGTRFEKSIKKAIDKGVLNGYDEKGDVFKPGEPLTRGQFAAVLDRLGLLE